MLFPMVTGRKRERARGSRNGPAAGGWGCPHDDRGACVRRDAPCDPGADGCVLEGRVSGPKGSTGPGDGKEGR